MCRTRPPCPGGLWNINVKLFLYVSLSSEKSITDIYFRSWGQTLILFLIILKCISDVVKYLFVSYTVSGIYTLSKNTAWFQFGHTGILAGLGGVGGSFLQKQLNQLSTSFNMDGYGLSYQSTHDITIQLLQKWPAYCI